MIPKEEQEKLLEKYKDKSRYELIKIISKQDEEIDNLSATYKKQTKLRSDLVEKLLPKLLKIKEIKEKEEAVIKELDDEKIKKRKTS